ncbi:related to PCF11 component of pre-mRNA 3`-end processing factor CF I [Cephalotrichum gorgonifer]|uniref:Related to PCF11 component of pre-mRNA 3`-end processing factor CF I n=1 Tax=Cephalotrichum gorgonifer TaxID=2041049 RepID=A0AAE8SW84_9PEZI|nr:related to PCF11 component of pre-mRNA 3`-end processing factor CF I [Cephalotrichum gorgonifer]
MSSENVAAEVAEDFKLALEDMTSISRVEIMNLCQIAREHTEHAYEISEVLVAHINRTAPQRKLASLYVLDAIVKNVGTPYTLYVAPKLYSTFMESYARVDHPVRRKMEEMLKTWKGPVPGSMDTKPVFPPDVVLPIETALIKVHTSMQANRKPQPHLRQQPGHRNTPTPPGMNHPHAPGPYPNHTPPNANGIPSGVPQSQTPFQPPIPGAVPAAANHSSLPYYGRDALAGAQQQQQQQQQQPGYGASAAVNADVLNRDIEGLIVASHQELAQNPHDVGIQTRLKALVDLQGIVRARNLPQDQLVLVKKQVDELSVKMRAPAPLPAQVGSGVPLASHVTPPPHHHLSRPSSAAPQIPTAAPASSTPVAGQAPLSIDSLLGKGALAALLAQQAASSRHATPTPVVQTPPPPPASAPAAPAPAASNPMDIIQQLRQAGLLGSAPPAPPPQAPAASAVPGLSSALASLPPVLANALAPMNRAAAAPPPPEDLRVISWSASSLRVVSLYSELGPPCTQCGRRFKQNEEGKKKKTAHMDWHFRVRQRMAEAERRGQYRSLYVAKDDWIKSREEVDVSYSPAETEAAPAEPAAKPPEQLYIPVPDPTSGVNTVCPICQERFENKWLDSAQEWVWLDAKMVGGRAFHASCHIEATKDRERGATPDGVLGKRKADGGGENKVKKSRG